MKSVQTQPTLVGGWSEALLSVSDIDNWKRFYAELDDWEVRYEGDVSPEELSYLYLPAGTKAREALICRANSNSGFVRLISFTDAGQQQAIRSNAQPWDTGGWFDLNSRVDDIDTCFMQLQKLGWTGCSDPVQWSFGSFTVKEWLACGSDGINLALIERIDPPLDADKQPGKFGVHFNATQMVEDISAARHFYEEVLGFSVVVEVNDQPVMSAAGPNVLGVPHELAATQHWNIVMLEAPGAAGGNVEVVSLPGLPRRSFADRANPPNRGIISLRFPVDDVASLHKRLRDANVTVIHAPQFLELAQIGRVIMMTAKGPDGARLDFFQKDA